MKTILFSSILVALAAPVFAAPGAAAKSPELTLKAEAKPGDAAWTTLEGMFRGPTKRPATKEEAVEVLTAFFKDFDEKAAAYRKDFPTDSRRWKLSLEEVKMKQMRTFAGLPAKDSAKILGEVIAAPDADKETKGFAS